jgi:hypothetical protein
VNENTPSTWKTSYKDYSAGTAEAMKEEAPLAETTERMDVLTAPAVPPVEPTNGEAEEKTKSKKRKKKDAEAEEEPEDAEAGEKKKKKKKKAKSEE